MLAKVETGEAAHRINGVPPPATTDEGTPDMALRSIQRENGADLAFDRQSRLDENLGRLIRKNWKWLFGILLTAGYICLPATVWQLNALSATVDKNQAVILGKLETQASRLAAIDKAADLQNGNTAQIAAVLQKVSEKLDGIDGKLDGKLDQRPTPKVVKPKPKTRPHPETTLRPAGRKTKPT